MYYLNGHSNIIALNIEYTVVTVQGGSPRTAAYGISFGSLVSGKVYLNELNEQPLLDQELNESC